MYRNSQRSILGAITRKEEIIMKISSKWMVLTIMLVAVVVLFFVPVHAQSPTGDVKPTFISPDSRFVCARVAGLYRILPQGMGGPASPARSFFSCRSGPTGFTPFTRNSQSQWLQVFFL